jgi:hypothetical protein
VQAAVAEAARAPWRAVAAGGLALVLGAGLKASEGGVLDPSRRPPGPAHWIAADRDGGALVFLDADLFVVERRSVPWPTKVRAARGGIWTVSAVQGHPKGEHDLRWTAWDGSAAASVVVPPVIDLETDADGSAWLLARTDSESCEVLRAVAQGLQDRIDAPSDARSLAVREGRVGLAAGASGFLVLDEERCAWLRAQLPGAARALDAAAIAQGWWVLLRDALPGSERLVRLDLELNATAAVAAAEAERIAEFGLDEGSGVWLLGGSGTWARRSGPRHGEELAFVHLSALGVNELAADTRGAVLLAAAGALLRFDGAGFPAPGQGGFSRLVDLTRVPAP